MAKKKQSKESYESLSRDADILTEAKELTTMISQLRPSLKLLSAVQMFFVNNSLIVFSMSDETIW